LAEDGAKELHLAAPCSSSTVRWISKLAKVNVADTFVTERLTQHGLRKAGPTRLSSLANINQDVRTS
jgi:hypothetical protein